MMRLSLLILFFWLLCIGVLVVMSFSSRIGVDGGRIHRLNWTVEGVRNYTSIGLQTELGDKVILDCIVISNLWIQTERIKYDTCNASAGTEKPYRNGACLVGRQLILTLTMNSARLKHDINFQDDQTYYFISYSDGSLYSVLVDSAGGQCEDGLKMILHIGRSKMDGQSDRKEDVSRVDNPNPGSLDEADDPGSQDLTGGAHLNVILIGALAGGMTMIILILVTVIAIICATSGYSKKKLRVEKNKSIPTSSRSKDLNDTCESASYDNQYKAHSESADLEGTYEPIYDDATDDCKEHTETIEMKPNFLYKGTNDLRRKETIKVKSNASYETTSRQGYILNEAIQ